MDYYYFLCWWFVIFVDGDKLIDRCWLIDVVVGKIMISIFVVNVELILLFSCCECLSVVND